MYSILDFPGTIAEQRNKKVVQKRKKVTPKQVVCLLTEVSAFFFWHSHFEQYRSKNSKAHDKKDQTVSMSPRSSSLSFTNNRRIWITCTRATKPQQLISALLSRRRSFQLSLSTCRGGKESHAKIKSELSQWWSFFTKSKCFPLNYYHLTYFHVAAEGQ